jgi:hypothetical protein
MSNEPDIGGVGLLLDFMFVLLILAFCWLTLRVLPQRSLAQLKDQAPAERLLPASACSTEFQG